MFLLIIILFLASYLLKFDENLFNNLYIFVHLSYHGSWVNYKWFYTFGLYVRAGSRYCLFL